MPELPEVETVLRGLRPYMQGEVLESVQQNRPNLRYTFPVGFVERLEGRRVVDMYRRAKYIIFDLDSDDQLILHLGMSGHMQISLGNYQPKLHDHVVFRLSSGAVISYNDTRRFGFMDLWPKSKPYKAFSQMGPEPFSSEFSATYLGQKFKGKHTPIKTALLDQSVVAGLGNIYVCEVLFLAKIHPMTRCDQLDLPSLKTLVDHVRVVLKAAITAGGSTLRDHQKPDGEMGCFQHNFNVYGREHMPCITCLSPLWRSVQAGRSTFYCPVCQKF